MTWADYVAMLRRRWRVVSAVVATVALGSIYVAYSLPPVYESSVTILIEDQGIPTDYVQTTVNAYAEELIQTIHKRVVATPNVLDMIDRLDLYPEERQTLPDDELVALFQDSTGLAPQNVTTVHSRTGRETIVTFGFEVTFDYPDPVKARDVVQELAELYVSQNDSVRSEAAARTTEFLDAESERLQQRLSEVADRIARFKEAHENNLPEDQGVNLEALERTRDELTKVETLMRDTRERKALLETDLAETPQYRPVLDESGQPVLGGIDRLAEAQQELIRLRGRYSEDHPEIVNLRREIAALSSSATNQGSLAQQLRADLEARRQELAAARKNYSDDHPDVVRLQRAVSSLEDQLSELDSDLASTGSAGGAAPNNPVYLQLLTRIETAEQELADLTRRQNELNTRARELERRRQESPQVEREYTELTHEQGLLLDRYRELRGLKDEATLAEDLESGESGERLSVIEPPRVPSNPVSPNRLSLSFLGFVLAMALGLGAASVTEAVDSSVRGQRDVYQLLEMPPMGIIPYVESQSDRLRRITVNAMIAVVAVGAAVYVAMTVVS